MKPFILFFGLFPMFANTFAQNSSRNVDALVNETVAPFISDPTHVGLAVSFLYNGKQYFYNYGVVDKTRGAKVTSSTVFEIGSITKTFAGFLLARAVVDNKVHLDDDVRKYLKESYPNLEYNGHPIKLFHLLNHSSGLPYDFINRKQFESTNTDSLPWLLSPLEKAYNKKQLLQDLHTIKIDTIPGIKLQYSNAAAQLLSYILEQLYHKPYKDLIKKFITGPQKMIETGFQNTLNQKNIAKGYNKKGQLMPYNQSGAAGGLFSTSTDLLRYGILQLDENKKEVSLSHQPTWGQIQYYAVGLNWQMQEKEDRRIWQSGGTAGFTSLISIYPEKKICFVFLANEEDEDSQGEFSKMEAKLLEGLRKQNDRTEK